MPEFALPYLRFGISVISLFLVARLLKGQTLQASATAARQPRMPYQRGQLWVRRFRYPAEALCLALAALISTTPSSSFVSRALQMLEALGWIRSHRFLFSQLRVHLMGWPRFLAPAGRSATLRPASPPSASETHSICLASGPLPA